MSRTQCYEWFKRFKGGRASVSEYPRPGRPSTSTNDRHVETVRDVMRGSRRLTVREETEDVGIACRILPSNFNQKISDAPRQCKICPLFAD